MLDNESTLAFSAREIELIEGALQTQKKILSVQSEAGGSGAGQRLEELSRLARRVGRARRSARQGSGWSFGQVLRGLFCTSPRCTQNG